MAHIKIKGVWYLEESLTDADRKNLGISKRKPEKAEKKVVPKVKKKDVEKSKK